MSNDLAFVGDVHGNLSALYGILDALARHGAPHIIFLGDYINKGAYSAEVMQELISYSHANRATLLRGNHESALLDALETGHLTNFLKMGGAMTIRSYAGQHIGPDVLAGLRATFPREHLEELRRMPETYEADALIAQHSPHGAVRTKFLISAHVPVGPLPQIGSRSAQLDTGCGTESGRLTALFWPSLNYVQVDANGIVVSS